MIFTLEIYLASLKEGSWFGFTDNHNKVYENLIIRDGSKKPTEQECIDGVKAMQAEYDSKQYIRNRLQEYPSIQELVVALYDADDKAEIDKKRAEIKKKYPKPE